MRCALQRAAAHVVGLVVGLRDDGTACPVRSRYGDDQPAVSILLDRLGITGRTTSRRRIQKCASARQPLLGLKRTAGAIERPHSTVQMIRDGADEVDDRRPRHDSRGQFLVHAAGHLGRRQVLMQLSVRVLCALDGCGPIGKNVRGVQHCSGMIGEGRQQQYLIGGVVVAEPVAGEQGAEHLIANREGNTEE